MAGVVARPRERRGAVQTARHVLRSPKGYMLVLLGSIVLLGAASEGIDVVAGGLVAAVVAALLADVVMRHVTGRPREFSSGAIVTGLVVALVLSPYAPWYVPALASAIGIVAKYLLRSGTANVLNPAAAGLVAAHLLLGYGESWWGGLPDYGVVGALLVLLPGLYIVDHVNKLPLVLAFFGAYFALFTASAFGPHADEVASIFRAPDAHMAIFFACFMLDDPPTSPVHYRDQLWYGTLIGVGAYALFIATNAVYFLSAALLVGNVIEAARRRSETRRRHSKRARAVAR